MFLNHINMLVKLYNQQQQQQQPGQLSPMGAVDGPFKQQQPDDQALAAVMAANQLLQLQNFGRQQQHQIEQQLQIKTQQQQQQQPLHQLNHFQGHCQEYLDQDSQQLQLQQQQQQPFDLSVKSASAAAAASVLSNSSTDSASTDSSLNNSSTCGSVFEPQPFKIIRDKDNNFSCQYCNKKYPLMGALKMHVRTHTLPCHCKICGKSFSRPWLLQGHIRTHTGEKPFKCDQCHRAFADRSNLRAHLQTHAKVKKYSCKCCLKTFSRMSLQVKHEEHCNINYQQQNNQQTSLTPTDSGSTCSSVSSQKLLDD